MVDFLRYCSLGSLGIYRIPHGDNQRIYFYIYICVYIYTYIYIYIYTYLGSLYIDMITYAHMLSYIREMKGNYTNSEEVPEIKTNSMKSIQIHNPFGIAYKCTEINGNPMEIHRNPMESYRNLTKSIDIL